jgi:hypothetical protein
MNVKEIESLKKKSITHLELSKDTKTNITNADIDKMTRELKLIATRKNLVVVVFEV